MDKYKEWLKTQLRFASARAISATSQLLFNDIKLATYEEVKDKYYKCCAHSSQKEQYTVWLKDKLIECDILVLHNPLNIKFKRQQKVYADSLEHWLLYCAE